MAGKIGLFYGSNEGNGAAAADVIKELIEQSGRATVDIYDIAYTDLKQMEQYDYLILGVSTWNIGQLQDDWEAKFHELDSIDFNGKTVALYGMGDQYGYPDSFVDAIDLLGAKLMQRGAEPAGFLLVDDTYEFEYSRAVIDGIFIGLALDDDNQPELTRGRIQTWIETVLQDFGMAEAVAA